MKQWEPINYLGQWNHDPRGELLLRAKQAFKNNDTYVAIPVELAIACGNLRECKARRMLSGDEDGPFQKPIEIHCRKPEGHIDMHTTGTLVWKDEI